ncbi:MAG: aminotransferase class V-fold PLP-dependent enzyme [Thermodesulfobacteriota bacterium]
MTFFALPPAEARLPLQALYRGLLPLAPDFSDKLGKHVGAEVCGLANNARTLFYLLFKALRSRASFDRGEILLPGYTCYSVAAAAVKAGCKVALYDLDPSSFQPDFADVKEKITARTLAVVGQHLLGVEADINRLVAIAHDHGLCCIEDAAQHLGSVTGASTVSQRNADFSVFSFGRGKPLPLGGGGALIARGEREFAGLPHDFELLPADKFTNRLLPFAVQILSRPRLYWLLETLPLGLGQTVYNPDFGVSTMPSFYQRIGASALPGLEKLNQHRAGIGRLYQSLFSQQADVLPAVGMPAYVRYPLLVSNQQEVRRMTSYGVRQLYPLALCDLPALQADLVEGRTQARGAREIARRLVTLPTHLAVDASSAKKIAGEAHRYFRDIETIQICSKESGDHFAEAMQCPAAG